MSAAIYQDHTFATHYALYEMTAGEAAFWDHYLDAMADQQFPTNPGRHEVSYFFRDYLWCNTVNPSMKPVNCIW